MLEGPLGFLFWEMPVYVFCPFSCWHMYLSLILYRNSLKFYAGYQSFVGYIYFRYFLPACSLMSLLSLWNHLMNRSSWIFCSKLYQFFWRIFLCLTVERLFYDVTAVCPTSWTQARTEVAFFKPPLETGHNWCSFWHKAAPLPCLLLCAVSWNRLFSWPGQACSHFPYLVASRTSTCDNSPHLYPI